MIFDFLTKKPTAASDNGQRLSQTFKIVDMHCASCALNIDDGLEEQAGIFKSRTQYAQAQTTVEFDPTRIDVARVQKIIKDLGYTAQPAA